MDMSLIRSRWWIGAPLLAVVALYVLPLAGAPPATNPNELARIELGVAMATGTGPDIGLVAAVYGLSEDVARRGERIYSDKAPGLSRPSRTPTFRPFGPCGIC